MSSGFINVSNSQNGNLNYYLRENECTKFKHSVNEYSKVQVLEHWKQIHEDEKLGNKELGIRGRHDARVRKNYTLSLPNSLTDKECISRLENVIQDTPIKNCTWTICIHKGEKDGIINKHAHLIVNERDLNTMKKDREMIKKSFLEKEFRPSYQAAFHQEFNMGKDLASRERIHPAMYHASKGIAKETVREYEEVVRSSQIEVSGGLFEAMQMLSKGIDQSREADKAKQIELQRAKEREAARVLAEAEKVKEREAARILAEKNAKKDIEIKTKLDRGIGSGRGMSR